MSVQLEILFDFTRRRLSAWSGAVILATCLWLLSTGAALAQEGAVGKIVHLRGQVEVFSGQGKDWQPGATGRYLNPGDAVRTGPDGWLALLMADESLIQVNRNSQLVLREVQVTAGWHKKGVQQASLTRKRSHYDLKRGRLWLRNKNRQPSVDVQTPTISAAVRGTEFEIRVAKDDTVTLTVIEGLVGASGETGAMEVAKGEQLTAKPGQPLTKRVLLHPEDAVQWIIPLPDVIDYRDLPLLSADRSFLEKERVRLETFVNSRPEALGERLRLAAAYRDLGQPDRAGVLFEQALKDKPEYPTTLTGLGWVRLDQGRYEEAAGYFNRVLQPGPMTYLGRAALLAAEGKTDQALELIGQARRRYGQDARLAAEEAYLNMASGRVKAGEAQLAALTEAQPKSGLGWGLLALSKIMLGQPAVQAADRAVTASPGSPNLWLIASLSRQAAYDLPAAEKAVRQGLAVDPNHPGCLVNLAKLLFAQDYVSEAWQKARQAVRLAPRSAEAHNLLGFLHLAKGDLDRALASFKEALRLDAGLGEPHLGLALVLMRRGAVEPALEEMSTAVLLEPRRALFVSYWGKMLYQVRRFDRAMDVLQMARALDKNDPTPLLYQAIILRDRYRPTEAIKAMNQAMALNDNRAVYRSRLLLDKDEATKNVALSILYDTLGLEPWAFNKATQSIKNDYLNSAGHLFLAGALFGLEGRDRAAESEELMARLLQPANQNAFNQFNEYTSMFERPDVNLTVEGKVAEQETYQATAILDGAWPAGGLAFQAWGAYEETDGWRETNYERFKEGAVQVKWQPDRNNGLMLTAFRNEATQGDKFYPRYEIDDPASSYDRTWAEDTKFEVGYHLKLTPKADLTMVGTYYKAKGTINQQELIDRGIVSFDLFREATIEEPYWQGQAQMQVKAGNHQIIFGSVQYWGSNETDNYEEAWMNLGGDRTYFGSSRILHDLDKRYHSYYIQDTWQVNSWLTIEGAAYLDFIEAANGFFGTQWTQNEFGPRVGIILTPTKADTIRLAAFRYMLPFYTSRIDPMDVAGVTIFRNHQEGSVAQEADLVWEHEWSSGYLTTNLFHVEREYTYKAETVTGSQPEITEDGRMSGAEVGFNQLLWSGAGLAAKYRFLDVTDDGLPSADRQEHLASLGLTYLHPSGLWVKGIETFRHVNLDDPTADNENIWLTDVAIGWKFPNRRGSITLGVNNLFDQEFNWVTDFFVTTGRAPTRQLYAVLSFNF